MAHYLKTKSVKQKLNSNGYQITKDGLVAIDEKIDTFLNKLTKQFNGHHKRITANLVALTGLK